MGLQLENVLTVEGYTTALWYAIGLQLNNVLTIETYNTAFGILWVSNWIMCLLWRVILQSLVYCGPPVGYSVYGGG